MNDSVITREFLELGHSPSCPVIDLHAHYGHFNGIYMPNHDPAQMIATMDRCGVAMIVTSGHTALVDMVRGNEEIAQISRGNPGRWYGYSVYNPNYEALGRQELGRFAARKTFVGLKVHPSFHHCPLTDDAYRPAFEFAASERLLVLSHTWGSSPFDRPELLAQVAERYPEAIFLAGHSGHGQFEECMDVARGHPNVYLELTAAYAVRGLVERMVEKVGSHKIVFGYDLPWFDPHYAIGCVVMAHITDEARYAILRGNALRLLEGRIRG